MCRKKMSLQKADWKSRYEPTVMREKWLDHPWPSQLFLLVLLAGALCISPVRNHSVPSAGSIGVLQRFSRSHFAFSLDLYAALARQNPDSIQQGASDSDEVGNLLFSPYGVSTVLAILFLGAGPGSSTALQLRSALHLNNFSFSDVHASYKTVLRKLADPYYTEVLAAGNGIFQQEDNFISEKYREALSEFYFGAELKLVDFVRHPQLATETINIWARNSTEGKIFPLMQTSMTPFDPSTRIILANALAFRSKWLFRFDRAMTFDKGLFYTTSKKRFEIPMMVGRFKVPVGYSSDLECRVAELPFVSRRISLFIILPDEVDRGLAKLEANMTSDNVKALFSTLKDEVVNIRLPRFRLQQNSDGLLGALQSMGIVDVFDKKKADLSGMSLDKLHVNDIFHKTFLEVDEEGAEAPIASDLNRLGSFGEKYFEVDHPFVFFLWDYHSGILLFLGRVTAPEPWIGSST